MIKIRPLIQVLGKIIKLPKGSYIDPESLGSGTPDGTNFLRGDGTWATAGGGAGSIPHGTATGTDTYSVAISGVTSLNDGDAFLIRFTNGNTTGCTLNINSLGAKVLYRNNDGPLIGGDILDGAEMLCIYNSSLNTFQAIGTSPNLLLAYVTNADSVTITKGQPVYAFGGTGDRLKVKLAYNSSDATSAQTVGLVLSTSIGVNQKGLIVVNGLLDGLSILPTSTWSDGDPVYLGSTAGTITNVKPYAPNHLVYLGFVTTASNGSAGRLYVRVQNGYEIQELHDVSIPTTPTDGQVLTYDLSTSLWKAKTVSPTLTVGTTPITNGTIGRILFESGGNVIGQDSALFWDNTNKRLGVGATPASTVRLDVRAQGALSTDIGFRVRNSANTQNSFEVNGLGEARVKTTGMIPKFSIGYDFAGSDRNAFVFTQNIQNNRGQQWTFDAGYNGLFEGLQIFNDLTGNELGLFTIQLNNFCFGTRMLNNDTGTNERRVLRIANGVAPTTSKADEFKFYSADIVAGNAAPHFRTENGSIIKLYKETTSVASATLISNLGVPLTNTDTFDGYTLSQVVKALRNQGLLA